MNATIHRLPSASMLPGDVDAEIVNLLEEFLEMAKVGKLRNVALAAIDHDLCAHTAYVHKGRSTLTLSGAIGSLNRRMELADD